MLTIEEAQRRNPDMAHGQVWRGAIAKYEFKCPIHGAYSQMYRNHNRDKRCPKCAYASKLFRPILCAFCGEKTPALSPKQKWCQKCVSTEKNKRVKNYNRKYHEKHRRIIGRPRITTQDMYRRCPDLAPGQKWLGGQSNYRFNCAEHGEYTQRFDNHRRLNIGCLDCYKQITTEILCVDCGKTIKRRKGGHRKFCASCKKIRRAAVMKKSNEKNSERCRRTSKKWHAENVERVSVMSHYRAIFNESNKAHKTYEGMPFESSWDPNKGGSFDAAVKWIIANIGKRPKNHTLDVVRHELGFVPGNLRWLTPKGQRRNQLIERISLLEHENEQLRKELMELKKEYTKCDQCGTHNRGGDECRECGADLRVETKELKAA